MYSPFNGWSAFEFPDAIIFVFYILRGSYFLLGGDSSRPVLSSQWTRHQCFTTQINLFRVDIYVQITAKWQDLYLNLRWGVIFKLFYLYTLVIQFILHKTQHTFVMHFKQCTLKFTIYFMVGFCYLEASVTKNTNTQCPFVFVKQIKKIQKIKHY